MSALHLPNSRRRVLGDEHLQTLNRILGAGYTVRMDPGLGQEPACVTIMETTVMGRKSLVVEGRSDTMDRAFYRAVLTWEARMQDGYRR